MVLARCVLTIIICGLMSYSAQSEENRYQIAHVTSHPEQNENDKTSDFEVDLSQLESKEWKTAIEKALRHQQGRGNYTLMRVLLQDGPAEEEIQAKALKLKALTEQYDGGGGLYFVVKSGGFLLFEHTPSFRRVNHHDPVQLGSFSHGGSLLWVENPQNGVLNVTGDIILTTSPKAEHGTLQMHVSAIRGNRFQLGPVMVGGSYGKTFQLDAEGNFELSLPPGKYKLLMPEFDLVKSRWDIQIRSGKTTLVEFDETEQIDVDSNDVRPSSD